MKVIDEQLEHLIYLAEDAIYECDYEHAKKLLISAVYDEPGYYKLHYTLAWMYHYHQVNENLAERHYQATIHFEPGFLDAYRELSALYFKRKKYNELQILMDRASISSDIPKEFVYETRGSIQERMGNYKNAIFNYKKALMYYMDNDDLHETRKTIKRVKWKRFKSRFN